MTRDARHQDEDGVIGDRPARDQLAGLPMFPSVAEAEAALRRDFLAAPPEREAAQTGTFDAITDRERVAGIERIQREVRDPLLAIALLRKDLPTDPGVTATDVRVLAEQRGLAHLVGTQQRA